MGQMLQTHERTRLYPVPAHASGNHAGAEADLPLPTLDRLSCRSPSIRCLRCSSVTRNVTRLMPT